MPLSESTVQTDLRARLQRLDPALYPYQGKYLDRGGLRYHYLDEGSGAPVVMIHGNPTWSLYYRSLVEGLRGTHRCIVPDHMGCGFSDKPGDDGYAYTLAKRIDDLEALLEHLGLRENITLVVHDWGGLVGMGYAARHPERIARIAALNTMAFHIPPNKPLPWSLWLVRTPLGVLLVRGLNMFVRVTGRIGAKRRPLSPALRAAFAAPYDSWAHRIGVQRFVEDIPVKHGDASYDEFTKIEAALPKFAKTPILICWGEQDFVFDLRILEEWKKRCSHAQVLSFPDGGHLILEDAAPEILERLRAFLDAPARQSAPQTADRSA
ncbi:MAG: alpha/beta fold hydrolase [Planctomycetes bacterium]|nr:alpha/beta fold hydrolase [Planctomycetota bacterium]